MFNDSLNRTQTKFEEVIGRLSVMSGEQDTASIQKVVDSVAPDISDLHLQMSTPNQPLPDNNWTVVSDYLAVSTHCDASNISIDQLHFSVNHLGRITSIEGRNSGIASTAWLAELPHLERLHLLGGGSTECDYLGALSQLKDLSLNNLQPISFNFLKSLVNLRELWVRNTGLSDLSPFAELHSLENLTLMDNGIADISPLVCLKDLRELHIVEENILDLSPLSQLSELTSVTLVSLPRQDLRFLHTLPKLQQLRISADMIARDRDLRCVDKLQDKGVRVEW